MHAQNDITIQPLNPDNDFHLRHVDALFERAKLSKEFSPSVRSGNYWKLAASRKFTPLLAIHCGKVIAHCGLGTSERSPATGVIFHPLIEPESIDLAAQVASKFEAVISSQARRRNLSSLLHFGTGEKEIEGLLTRMGFISVAELQHGGGTREVRMRLIKTESRSLEHVPQALRKQVARAYGALGINSVLSSAIDAMPMPLSADEPAIDIIPLARMGRALAFVNGSLLVGKSITRRLPHALSDTLRRWPRAIVCVNMADHGCSQMSELLKANQFEYKGVLPAVRNRDSLLFARGFENESSRPASPANSRRKSSAY